MYRFSGAEVAEDRRPLSARQGVRTVTCPLYTPHVATLKCSENLATIVQGLDNMEKLYPELYITMNKRSMSCCAAIENAKL